MVPLVVGVTGLGFAYALRVTSIDDVGAWLDALYIRTDPELLCAEPLVDPEDFGVPDEMREGGLDEAGNVRWKLLLGTLPSNALALLEARVGVLPLALSGWLLARHHLFNQVTTHEGHLLALPPTPIHAPLRHFMTTLESWAELLDAGWLPIGDYSAGLGPLCLDLGTRARIGDAPVVWFDHEALIAIDEADRRRRSLLSPLGHPLYDSFEALLEDILQVG